MRWGDERGEAIVNSVKGKGIKKATFLVWGSWGEGHGERVGGMVKEGDEMGRMG